MNGNPLYHGVALAVSTALILPLPLALLAGWKPRFVRDRPSGMRLRAHGSLCLYAAVLVNGVPRIADAPAEAVAVCGNVGFGFAAAAVVLFLLPARKDSGARPVGPAEPRER